MQQPLCYGHGQTTASQPESLSYSMTGQQQSMPKYNRRAHISHTGDTPESPGTGDQGEYTLSHTRHPLYKETWPKLRDIANLPNT